MDPAAEDEVSKADKINISELRHKKQEIGEELT